MIARPIALPDLTNLKAATLDLVKAVGGVERASEIAGVSKSHIARWYASRDEKNPDEISTATIDAISIAVLEADLAERGDPRRPVTACLARLGGRRLADEAAAVASITVGVAAASFLGSIGPLAADLVKGLSAGEMTATGARTVNALAARAEEALAALRSELAAASSPRV